MQVPGSPARDSAETRRFELTLNKPRIGWFPKPTVVFDGRGNPAQWGTGTWRVNADGTTVLAIFLFNRLWRFGEAEVRVTGATPVAVTYTAPWFPFGRGRIQPTEG